MDMSLKYIDDSDKCYGVTGMAIGIVALDSESLLESLSLDADPGNSVKFMPEYYFSGNPRLSARIAWNEILRHFQLSMAMMISNVMCRYYVGRHTSISDELRKVMLETVSNEGHDTCSLDDDEISNLFAKSYNYLHRLFSHNGVQAVASDFARTLSARRQLTRSEVIEELRALSML